jgi:molybdopterin converting factor small subunit
MKVKVKFYGRFRKLFGSEEKEIEAESGTTARSLVETLCVSQECRDNLFDEQGRPRRCVEILKKGKEKVQFADDEHVKLEDGDVVSIFPAWGI